MLNETERYFNSIQLKGSWNHSSKCFDSTLDMYIIEGLSECDLQRNVNSLNFKIKILEQRRVCMNSKVKVVLSNFETIMHFLCALSCS